MSAVIHREITVGPDGHIHLDIAAPELQPGQRVTVTIEPEAPTEQPEPSLYDLVKSLPGGRLFKTVEEVDEYLQQERDSWDH